ncbi:oxaloacetate decarboxylase, alpha subunit [Caloramator quimbayensis]|uniref:Oxaloacetate decarboxylase, alpha subunit n=1 Tax=Caloramator quimbayensis TaxID=1147123 RepID=A0A1T4WQ18_9CLOT|nr:pyruvate carboxylase subunit B [Caloramator quimbayensis]SKA79460.1 oxaloacetate decarboxylase, alpha subunit [Caloramator quimbayensis]
MDIKITETVLRDANQSLIATRLPFEDFENILGFLDEAGYYSLECWGGAVFDACLRYLKEDPWERLRKIKRVVKKTKLQMLLRGQNLLGYKHYPDDVVRLFIDKSVENGIDIIRIFDALNDFRNIKTAVDETIKMKAHAQGTIVYTISPIHNTENFVKLAKQLEDMGVDSICIKDMAGILSPFKAFEIVKALKEYIRIPIFLHTHCTTMLGPMSLLKAVEAGCDGIDTAISPFSGGTSQPPTETFYYILKEYGYNLSLNEEILKKISSHFKDIRDKFLDHKILNPYVLGVDSMALIYQVPGGMLSNLISQLKEQNCLEKLDDVLKEIPNVRAELGYPPLVTPMSQMVGTQAAANVLSGEKYKVILKEVKSYVRGEYGNPPGKINEDLKRKILGNEEPIKLRYADTLAPIIEKIKNSPPQFVRTDEDILTYLLFPQTGETFLKYKYDEKGLENKKTIHYAIKAHQ